MGRTSLIEKQTLGQVEWTSKGTGRNSWEASNISLPVRIARFFLAVGAIRTSVRARTVSDPSRSRQSDAFVRQVKVLVWFVVDSVV